MNRYIENGIQSSLRYKFIVDRCQQYEGEIIERENTPRETQVEEITAHEIRLRQTENNFTIQRFPPSLGLIGTPRSLPTRCYKDCCQGANAWV